ncbi:double zinc ribbon domain-containing protein [Halococcus sp. AFM35]|uniref:double zinc ribbon domain-containing protein n=1 Tax=Halococcus sp. AFM35 TaxID=3421653 RepID=UPI003EBE96FC
MSKITFRADDELIDELETLETSKSEAMREALRAYLARNEEPATDSLDAIVAERVDELIDERMDAFTPSQPHDVNVNITLDGDSVRTNADGSVERKTDRSPSQTGSDTRKTCAQCGEEIDEENVYCPNCGEKAAHRVFCDCGDELRSDWGFCPSCGRRTPAADVLDGA